MTRLTFADVTQARDRIAGRVRPVAVLREPPGRGPFADLSTQVVLVLEHLQYSGSFKIRGAQNFLLAQLERDTLPAVGVTIASGGNAGLACAWAARDAEVPATIFLPENAPATKADRLTAMGVDVRLTGRNFAAAAQACQRFADETGAVTSHAYDHPLIAAGAGTLVEETLRLAPDVDSFAVSVGGGGLFSGVATAAHHFGLGAVAVEPEHCCCLNAALAAGAPVDSATDSVAADALGATRASSLAVATAVATNAMSMLVGDDEIVAARNLLWQEYRLVVEHAAAAALAGVLAAGDALAGRTVAVVLCGANTDPATLG